MMTRWRKKTHQHPQFLPVPNGKFMFYRYIYLAFIAWFTHLLFFFWFYSSDILFLWRKKINIFNLLLLFVFGWFFLVGLNIVTTIFLRNEKLNRKPNEKLKKQKFIRKWTNSYFIYMYNCSTSIRYPCFYVSAQKAEIKTKEKSGWIYCLKSLCATTLLFFQRWMNFLA